MNCVFVHESVAFNLVDQINKLLLFSLNLARELLGVHLFLLNDLLLSFGYDCSNRYKFDTNQLKFCLQRTYLGSTQISRLILNSVFSKNSFHVFQLFLLNL
jgi:hypothetical protein